MTYPQWMTPEGFAAKWRDSNATERAASQEHFIDLCRMLGVATPNEADPNGDWYAFEKGASKSIGGEGFADVWKKGHFAWEYKGKRKDLGAAYQQLLGYREALENPPLLVVCDLNRFEVRTNFTNTATKTHAFTLEDLRTDPAEPLRILRAVISDPEELRPSSGSNELTIEAASLFAHLAVSLATRYDEPLRIAHFLDKLLFCLYAENANVLPKGLVTRLIASAKTDPATFQERLADLFGRMASGGWFGVEKVDWFNGGLFADAEALELIKSEIAVLEAVSLFNWSLIEPAIFGTLFERGLDPSKRTQLGAHYTDRVSIERLVEPVVMMPLRREFDAAVAQAEALLAKGAGEPQEGHGDPPSIPRAPSGGARFGSRLRQWKFSLYRPPQDEGSRARGDRLGVGPVQDPARVVRPGRPAQRSRPRTQPVRGGTGPGDDLDRRDPVDDQPRLRLRP